MLLPCGEESTNAKKFRILKVEVSLTFLFRLAQVVNDTQNLDENLPHTQSRRNGLILARLDLFYETILILDWIQY